MKIEARLRHRSQGLGLEQQQQDGLRLRIENGPRPSTLNKGQSPGIGSQWSEDSIISA